jgi:hypothetical protein
MFCMPHTVQTGMTMQKKYLPPARRRLLAAIGAACLAALAACKKSDEVAPTAPVAFNRPDAAVHADVVIPFDLGGAFVAGEIFDETGPSSWGWIAKVDTLGGRLWEKELGKKARNSSFTAGMQTEKGNVLLAGTVNAGNASYAPASAWLLALTADGRMLWDRAFNFGSRTHALAITTVPKTEDGYLVMGSVRNGDRDGEHTDRAWVVRIDGAGHESLKKVLDSPDTLIPDTIDAMADGSFVVAGRVFVGSEQGMRGWIGRFAADGRPQWSRTLDLKESNIAAADVDLDDSIVMAVNEGREDAVRLMRLDGAGKTLKDAGRVALCGEPALWQTQEGRLQLGGLPCPGARGAANGIVVVPDLAHPDHVQRIAAMPGATIRRLVGLPGNMEIGLLGERSDNDYGAAVFATRPMP